MAGSSVGPPRTAALVAAPLGMTIGLSSLFVLVPVVNLYAEHETTDPERFDLGTGFLLMLLIIPATLTLGVACCAFAMHRVGADRIGATMVTALLFLVLCSPVISNGPTLVVLLARRSPPCCAHGGGCSPPGRTTAVGLPRRAPLSAGDCLSGRRLQLWRWVLAVRLSDHGVRSVGVQPGWLGGMPASPRDRSEAVRVPITIPLFAAWALATDSGLPWQQKLRLVDGIYKRLLLLIREGKRLRGARHVQWKRLSWFHGRTLRRRSSTTLCRLNGRAYRLRSQGVIATLRRVLVMVSSSRGFVEGVR